MRGKLKKVLSVLTVLLILTIIGTAYATNDVHVTKEKASRPVAEYSAIFFKDETYTTLSRTDVWIETNSMTFNLPVKAYVYIESSGSTSGFFGYLGTRLIVDGTVRVVSWYGVGNYENPFWTGHRNSKIMLLDAGTHIVKVEAMTYGGTPYIFTGINVIANSKGATTASLVEESVESKFVVSQPPKAGNVGSVGSKVNK